MRVVARGALMALRGIIAFCLGFVVVSSAAQGQVELPPADANAPVLISAKSSARWRQGEYDVWHLSGDCRIRQGELTAQSHDAVVWVAIPQAGPQELHKAIVYLEGDVRVEHSQGGAPHLATGHATQAFRGDVWLGRFHSNAAVDVSAITLTGEPPEKPAVFYRGLRAREVELMQSVSRVETVSRQRNSSGTIRPAQFAAPLAAPPPVAGPANVIPPKRIRVFPRGPAGVPVQWFPSPSGAEQIGVLSAGVQIVVEGVVIENLPRLGTLDVGAVSILTDRAVVWTNAPLAADLTGEAATVDNAMWEFYLEGNIVFRQGDRVIYADRMYYNATQEYGVVLGAEILTPVPEYEGLLRLKADVLQQLNRQTFVAQGAAITSSRLGVPRYWLQSETITFQDNHVPVVDPLTGQPMVDPQTGEPMIDHEMRAESRNNWVYVAGLPVFYWPTIATNLEKSTFYVDEVRIGNDRVFGFQLGADFDVYQLLGVANPPDNTEWTIGADYLSERGIGFGTNLQYDRQGVVVPGPYRGFLDAWFINDQGLDNLGMDRRALAPEEEFRGRALFNHRHLLPNGYQLTAEAGWISDRNFLEQYYEEEWDTGKDQVTALELKRTVDNTSWSLFGQARVNDFFTQTSWLPRFDHYLTGQDIFGIATWHAHSNVGYGRLETATAPQDPMELPVQPLAWETDAEGLRAATRQEIDIPLLLGPVKVVPYALGEVGHWEEDITQDDVTRLYGQTGVRSSLSFWRTDPLVESRLFNLSGLAHKITFEGDVFVAQADEDLDRFPLYDPLDDDSQEHFRRRFIDRTFGGALPPQFDERYYALRSGMQGWVAATSTEIAEDLTAARLGVSQRWQTKRGLPGQQRIVDWIALDVEGVLFPNADRDNFGEELGLVDYNFRWHVGDRVTVLSDGFVDFFNDGLKTVSIGTMLSRPGRTEFYLGFRTIDGPIEANVITASAKYRMSEKWIADATTSYDFGPTGNIGQSVGITRIGESALFHVGFNVDESRDNVGVMVSLEPRFLPSRRGTIAGVPLAPPGVMGLE